ncbi:glycosyltransferase [Acinetobacter sp. UBA1297]|uniref:glycosyltransferase n=1 Tax=Acinetobacter sp. UBA1297 TaxID=1945925 RepID=UPI00257A99F5|nr:glycosyltransferase [Acinetobacter sp. UBA1297]
MKVLYIYDHKFITNNGNYFSEGKFSNKIFTRYDCLKANIVIISRKINSEQVEYYNKIDKENIKFSPVKGVKFYFIFSTYFFINLVKIAYYIVRSDLLIVRMPSILGLFVLSINLIFKKKYAVELVGNGREAWFNIKSKNSYFYKKIAILLDKIRKFHIFNANGVIYVTKKDLQKYYPTKGFVAVASNVEVNVEKNFYLDRKAEARDYYKIGLIGSFNNEYKGIETAIKAIKILKDQGVNSKLNIVGSGKLKEYYLNLAKRLDIEHDIIFLGSIKGGENIFQWLDSLDVYIQPSYTEGLPRALIEAMSRGLPAIATQVGGIPELLDKEYLIPPKDHKRLALSLINLLGDSHERYNQSRKNFEQVKYYDSNYLTQQREIFWKKFKSIN